MNDEFEDLLKRTLAREEPPADLSARVMRRVARDRASRTPWTVLAAVAAGLVVSLSGYFGYERLHSPGAPSQDPERQLVFALQLTSEKIAAVDARLKRSSPQLQLPYGNLREEK